MSERRGLQACPVPINFNGMFVFYGFSFKIINFIEGVALGAVLGLTAFFLAYDVFYLEDTPAIISLTIGGVVVGLFFGIRGVNADPIHTYIKHMIKQLTHRRKAQYNPRVKYEIAYALSLKEEEKKRVDTGLETKSLFQQYKEKLNARAAQNARHENEHEDDVEYIFEDDIGVIAKTPEELMKNKKKKPARKKNTKKGGGKLLNGLKFKK